MVVVVVVEEEVGNEECFDWKGVELVVIVDDEDDDDDEIIDEDGVGIVGVGLLRLLLLPVIVEKSIMVPLVVAPTNQRRHTQNVESAR